MGKIIADCFALGKRPYDGETIIAAVSETGNLVELENGVTLTGTGDGRYYDAGNDLRRYAQVLDWDDNADCGTLVGYTEL